MGLKEVLAMATGGILVYLFFYMRERSRKSLKQIEQMLADRGRSLDQRENKLKGRETDVLYRERAVRQCEADLEADQKRYEEQRCANEKRREELRKLEIAKQEEINRLAGKRFEEKVETELCEKFEYWLKSGRANLLYQVRIPNKNGYDYKIDFLLIDTSGIYIIECKSWFGLIAGNSEWKKWLHVRCEFKDGLPVLPKSETEDEVSNYPEGTTMVKASLNKSPTQQIDDQKDALMELIKATISTTIYQYKRMVVLSPEAYQGFILLDSKEYSKNNYFWLGAIDGLHKAIEEFDSQIAERQRLTSAQVEEVCQLLAPQSEYYISNKVIDTKATVLEV